MTTPTITSVRLTDLILDDDIQPRQRLDQGKITEYANLYKDGMELPPIVVFTDDDLFYVTDGSHRTHAARKAGLDAITAMVHEGTKRDAILYAIAANSTHPLALTADDKRRAVTRMLQDPEWSQWSDNRIAKHCGVAHSFVGRVRSSLDSETSETQPRTYTTKHGTTATMQTGRIGRGKAQPPTPAEDQAAPPAVLADGSSVLVHAPTPLANGSTPHRRATDLTRQAPTPLDPGSAPPADQHVPYFDLAELVQESVQVLAEIGSQLDMLAEDYPSFTAADGQPFASTWAFATAPLPHGRGCDLGALHASVTLLATQIGTLKAAAKTPTATPTTEQVTKRQQVLAVLPTLKAPFTAPKVVAATGLPIKEARRAMEGLVKVKTLVKVAGKPGQYRLARKR